MHVERYKLAMLALYGGVVITIGVIVVLGARWLLQNIGHPSVWTWAKLSLGILGLAVLGRLFLGWGSVMHREYVRRRDAANSR